MQAGDVSASNVGFGVFLGARDAEADVKCSRASVETAHDRREKFNKRGFLERGDNPIQTTLLPSFFNF